MHDKIEPPYHLKEFWTKYPHGLTIYEALLDWVDQVNLLIDANNLLVDEVDVIRQNYESYVSGVNDVLTNKAPLTHAHVKTDITDFAHGHVKADISDFTHAHVKTDITDFAHGHVKADISDFAHDHDITGTWEPTLLGQTTDGVGTYSKRLGKYLKIGKLVHFEIELVWSAHSGTGNMMINNMPYQIPNDSIMRACSIISAGLTFSGQLVAGLIPNSNAIVFYQQSSGSALSGIPMDTSASLYITGSYITN